MKIIDILEPEILVREKDFLIVYKPPRMHSAPLANSRGKNIMDWCAQKNPEVMDLPGRKPGEGGLLHRLDYETCGLLLIARTMFGMESLLAQQNEGKIIKEYSAVTAESEIKLSGFPAKKPELAIDFYRDKIDAIKPVIVESAFRPYGPGRKAVRPVLYDTENRTISASEFYKTEILESQVLSSGYVSFRLRILRGFRHQIRCHLAWLGVPIINDSLYGGISSGDGFLALKACSLFFSDPLSGEKVSFSI